MRAFPFAHQLETSDQDFLAHLRLPGRGGKLLSGAIKSDDLAACHAVVARHFRTRPRPAWSFYSHGSPWHQTDAPGCVIDKANNLLNHRFRNSWPPHQWMDLGNGTADPDWTAGLPQATTSLSRHTFVTELTTAFALTGDPKYATKALHLMRSFVGAFPFVLHPRFEEDHDTYFGGPADTSQLTAYRLFRWVDFLFSGAAHAPGVCSDEDVFWIVKQIWFYTGQFYRLLDDPLRRDNHHLLDHGHVPFVIALAFPEFDFSPELLRAGTRVIRHHFGHNLLPDGAYAEHSTNYQYHVLFHFAHPHGVAKANSVKLFTTRQVDQLRAWATFSAHAAKPDGTLPSIGDEPGRPLQHLFGSLAAPLMDKPLHALAHSVGCTPGSHQFTTAAKVAERMRSWQPHTPLAFGVSEYYRPATRQKPSATRGLPTPTVQYPHGGYTFFRSSHSPDADYLAVSHFSGDYGGHAHWDPMSFILHTRGKTLIGDPASWLYVSPRFHGHGGDHRKPVKEQPLLYRGYSYSVNAHNCLVMNDDTLKPLEAMNHGTFWGGYPPKHTLGLFHADGGPIELAELSHAANHPTIHRRFIVHMKGLGFLFLDLLSKRPNLAPHQYSQYFHFEPGVVLTDENPHLRASIDPASCLILPGPETESRWRTFPDAYLADGLYGVPATPMVAELTRRIRGQAVFSLFFLTAPLTHPTQPAYSYLGPRPAEWLDWQHDAVAANRLDLGPLGTLLIASAPYGRPVQTSQISTDAHLAIVHIDPRNRVRSWLLAYGRQLAVGERTLFSSRRPRDLAVS